MSTHRNVGLSLGAGRGVIAWWPHGAAPDAARTLHFTFDSATLAYGDPHPLVEVLSAVRDSLGDGRHRLFVALGSPWSSPREISLPPMRHAEARAVLERDVVLHFPRPFSEPVVTVRSIARRSPSAFLAADVDTAVLDALGKAAAIVGWELERVAPAVGAWARALGTATRHVFIVDREATVLDARRSIVERLRRCRAVDLPAETVSSAHAAAGRNDALELAARYAPSDCDVEFVPPAVRAQRRAVARRAVRTMTTVAAGLLALAAALAWWGPVHEDGVLTTERAALRASVERAMTQRDSIIRVEDQLATVARAERAAPKWSSRLLAIAAVLPDDAYLTAVRGVGDSVQVEGRAKNAAKVFEALRAARSIEAVRATAPIRLDAGPADTLESFSIAVRLRGPGAPR